MENYIKIDDEIMRLKATGGTLIWYKEQFGTDSIEMNEEIANTKFFINSIRDFLGF